MPYCESLLHLIFVSCSLALYSVFCFAVIRYALVTGEISCSWVSSVQFSHSVMSNSLWPHRLQHTRLPYPSPTTGACSNLCSSSQMNRVYFILCHPLLLPPSIFPSIRVFFKELALRIRGPEYWNFSISTSNECSGLISFRIDWFDLLAVQETLKSLLQHHNVKA